MATKQYYCTLDEIVGDLETPGGDVDVLLRNIQAASQDILREIGNFIPIVETRYFNGRGGKELSVPRLLSVTSILNDGTALVSTDYLLEPGARHWPNGPYSLLRVDPDAANLSVWYNEDAGVAVTGPWGLYSETGSTGAAVASDQTDSASSLTVDDGSKVSVGMDLLVGSEQELVTGYGSPTASVTTLNGTIDAQQESIVLTDGSKVKLGEIIRCGVEKMKVLDIATHTLYVRRGWNKTKPAAHTTAAAIDAYRTFTVERAANGTTAAAHATSAAISRYLVPGDVNFLAREIATLMLKKAQSGYSGKSGNAETGETYYHDAFPRFDIERVKRNYMLTE